MGINLFPQIDKRVLMMFAININGCAINNVWAMHKIAFEAFVESSSSWGQMVGTMVFKLDGNSEHDAHAWGKIILFGKKQSDLCLFLI